MKAYKSDFDGEKFITVEFDTENEPESNLEYIEPDEYVKAKATYHTKESAQEVTEYSNKYMVEELTEESDYSSFMVKKCKDCGKYFIFDMEEYIYLKRRKFKFPIYCHNCRIRRKTNK